MTGEEWLMQVRSMKNIEEIGIRFSDDFDGLTVFDHADFVVVADNNFQVLKLCHSVYDPDTHIKGWNHITEWNQAVSVCLVINKLMELMGRSERFSVGNEIGSERWYRTNDAIVCGCKCLSIPVWWTDNQEGQV